MTTEETAANTAQEQTYPQRKKYVFKKRDPVAAAKLEEERVAGMKKVRSTQLISLVE